MLFRSLVAVFAAVGAPLIFMGIDGIFGYFQKLNGVYFIPLLAVILVGMLNRWVNGRTAFITILVGLSVMIWGTFFGESFIQDVFGSGYHFMGAVFIALVILQLVLGKFMKREVAYLQKDAKKVDLTPWAPAPYVGVGLVTTVVVLYAMLAIL